MSLDSDELSVTQKRNALIEASFLPFESTWQR